MKENTKKQLRLQLIIAMAVIAMVIMAGEVTDVYGYAMKGAAMVLGASAYGMFKRWNKRNLLPRVEDL